MQHEVTVEYTEVLVKTATRRFIGKFLGWDYLAVGLVMLAGLIVLLALGQRWLLFVAKGVYSTLPTACLTDEVRQFIVEKLQEQGVTISKT